MMLRMSKSHRVATGTPKWGMFFTLLAGLASLAGICTAPNPVPVAGKPWAMPLALGGHLKMVWIAPGTFTMGSPKSEPGHREDETQFQVKLTHGFWMGATEVTVGEWRDVMGTDLRGHLTEVINNNTLYDFAGRMLTIRDFMNMSRDGDVGRYLANETDNLPIYFTSWNDAMEFCEKLSQRERKAGRLPAGYKYTLPTEAQWEYAARAGTTDATFAGPLVVVENAAPVLDNIAWYVANSTQGIREKASGLPSPGRARWGQRIRMPGACLT